MNTPPARYCSMAEQTVAWVLHSLEPGEEIEVVRHLPTCPSCRTLIQEAEAAAAGLGFAVDQVAPPAGLRDRILDEAERTPRVERPRPAAESPVEHDPASPVRVGRRLGSRPGGARLPSQGGRPGTHGRRIGVALAVVAALSGAGTYAARTYARPDYQSAQNTRSVQNTREAVAQAVADAVARSAAPGIDHAFLTPSGQGSAVAAVLVNASGRQVVTPACPPTTGTGSTCCGGWRRRVHPRPSARST